ncbi:MAG: penicillin-binding protein 2, partial [Armatimonadetes bacterium]|nr:penicillin-binding protein 2 [Armatimonadota bacterium]
GPRASEPRPSDRAEALFRLGAVLVVVLVLRVGYLQTIRRQHFADLANDTRSRTHVLPPRRGDVTDRFGAPVAMTQDVSRIAFDPGKLPKDPVTKETLPHAAVKPASVLAPLLGISRDEVVRGIEGPADEPGEHKRYRIIKEDATAAEVAAVRWFLRSRTYRPMLEGVVTTVVKSRVYAGGDSSTALIGVTVPGAFGSSIGTGGVERWANTALSGSVGWLQARVDRAGVPIPTSPQRVVSAVHGANVRLTIDLNVQRICAVALARCMIEHTPLGATAIVLDPTTGDVLGMVSRPSCDPNDRSEFGKAEEGLRNRALMLYEPGSVMKPVTVCIALDLGVITEDEVFACPGYRVLDGKRIGCEAHRNTTPPPGTNNARMVIAKSCNTATSTIAMRLGGKRLAEGMARFGLLDPPLSSHSSPLSTQPGWLEAGSAGHELKRGAVARIGFGQSVMVSPLGLASAFGAMVNRGVLMRPRLVQALTDQANRTIREFPIEVVGQAVSPEVAQMMASYLQTVVNKGTGVNARLDGHVSAGKTGTALKVKNKVYSEHIASFIGYVQARDKRVVIAVVVDEPENGYHGAQAAAPAWKAIAEGLMLYWHVPPTLQSVKTAWAGGTRHP